MLDRLFARLLLLGLACAGCQGVVETAPGTTTAGETSTGGSDATGGGGSSATGGGGAGATGGGGSGATGGGGAGATGGGGSGATGGGGSGATGGGGAGGSDCVAEVCDGLDNDCDGTVDEGNNPCGGACALPQVAGTPCEGPDTDACPDDVVVCDGANAVTCGPGSDNVEVCNGVDDDCNGTVDEGDNPCGGACALPEMPGTPCDGPDTDACPDDVVVCDGANAVTCSSGSDDVESCNGVDDDCNGTVDEGDNPCGGVCALPQMPGAPCDDPDADVCTDDVVLCSGKNGVVCSAGANNVDICDNGLDEDCDGTADMPCVDPPAPGMDCNVDGDDFPAVSCTPPPVGASDNVACVCAAPPCADPLCDTSHTSIAAAFGAIAPLSKPSAVLLFAGTYAGFSMNFTIGSGPTKPLFIGAHCAAGARAAVTLSSTVFADAPNVTLEGLRFDAELFVSTTVVPNNITLRDLVLHGRFVCFNPSIPSNDMLIERVEIYPAAGGQIAHGATLEFCRGVQVMDSAVCGATTTGWHVKESHDIEFSRVLAKDIAGAGFLVDNSGSPGEHSLRPRPGDRVFERNPRPSGLPHRIDSKQPASSPTARASTWRPSTAAWAARFTSGRSGTI